MRHHTIALFGEAEKGDFRTAHLLRRLDEVEDKLGNPPPESMGVELAIQTVLYERQLIFFRVREEGYSVADYLRGLTFLRNEAQLPGLSALLLPGVGDSEIISAGAHVCKRYHSILICSEADLYDYLTSASTALPDCDTK